ncbi:MAG: restriction endonuclease subunit S, partial [Microcystis panniformis]
MGEVASIGTGATPLTTNQEYYKEGNIPWITSSATNNLFVNEHELFITEKALTETNCKVYPIGTLVVAMYGQGKTRGQITELNIEAATNQACAAIELIEFRDFHRKFVKYFFRKIYDEIRELAQGGAQPNLNMGKIRETIIPLPSISEQQL